MIADRPPMTPRLQPKPPVVTGDSYQAAALAERGWWVEEVAVAGPGGGLRLVWRCTPPGQPR